MEPSRKFRPMKSARRTVTLTLFALLASLHLEGVPANAPFRSSFIGVAAAQAQEQVGPIVQGPFVGETVHPTLSPAVRALARIRAGTSVGSVREMNLRQRGDFPLDVEFNETDRVDPLLEKDWVRSAVRTPAPTLSFEGISFLTGGSGVPPDPVGDVGPNHYVQMVNTTFAIFNKSGTLLAGPTNINTLWTGAGGLCEVNNDGDPIVLYDPLADRWLISQFAVPGPSPNFALCIAISQTADPTGAYHRYEFPAAVFPDYPKFGVWPDAYYASTNDGGGIVGAYAFERAKMLAGLPATSIKFSVSNENFMLPSDLDGSTSPPTGSPNYFYTFMDSSFWGGSADRLEVWQYHVDFTTPANSTFTLAQSIPITSFTYTVCGFFVLACIPQPAPGQSVDAVSEWPMWRAPYRNFGSHETLLGNFTVDVGADRAGIRWFELRKTGSTWSLQQEGTHAPGSEHRFMGSAAMDQSGNIALGYSVSSSSVFPSLRYATRLATDPAGTLQSETTLIAGGGVQTSGFNRWGDYSALTVDPSDDCTFWYTGEYYATTSGFSWQTRIGSFRIPDCGGVADTIIDSSPPALTNSTSAEFTFSSTVGGSTFECSLDSAAFAACTSPKIYTALAAGSHTFEVRAIDSLGNTDATPASFTWTIDTAAPDTVIDTSPANPTELTNADFTFHSTEAGSSFQCQLDGGGFSPCASPKNYTALAVGNHTFNVKAMDGAGNTDATPAGFTWTVLPNTIINSGPAADPGGATKSTTADFNFTSTDPSATFECSLDSAAFSACTSPKTYTKLKARAHNFKVQATTGGVPDPTPASFDWTIDKIAPNTTITSFPDVLTKNPIATFEFTSTEVGGGFQCSLDGGAFADCTSPFVSASLLDGKHNFHVKAVDAAGNVDKSAAKAKAWTVDTIRPVTTITGKPTDPTTSVNVAFKFKSEKKSTFMCKLDSGAFEDCKSGKKYSGLLPGLHNFQVQATDAAGNVELTPASYSWTQN